MCGMSEASVDRTEATQGGEQMTSGRGWWDGKEGEEALGSGVRLFELESQLYSYCL